MRAFKSGMAGLLEGAALVVKTMRISQNYDKFVTFANAREQQGDVLANTQVGRPRTELQVRLS